MSDEPYSVKLEVTRGADTSNRDKIRATVEAETLDELDERMAAMKDRLEKWADDLRAINPRASRALEDDQSNLSDVEA